MENIARFLNMLEINFATPHITNGTRHTKPSATPIIMNREDIPLLTPAIKKATPAITKPTVPSIKYTIFFFSLFPEIIIV